MRDQRIDKLEKRMTAARCSIDTIIYMVMPALPESREPIGFRRDCALCHALHLCYTELIGVYNASDA